MSGATAIPVITIDGPSGSGKGTIAHRVATALGWHGLDSGALYRLLGLAVSQAGISGEDLPALAALAASLPVSFGSDENGQEQIWLEGKEVGRDIRTEECGRLASQVAAIPEVRTALLGLQRDFRRPPGLVADGRDMGTTVFVDAPLKIFLTASPEQRAKRRYKQLKDKGIGVSLPALSQDIAQRDLRDSQRAVAPLRPAADARILDSSDMTVGEVMATVLRWSAEKLLR